MIAHDILNDSFEKFDQLVSERPKKWFRELDTLSLAQTVLAVSKIVQYRGSQPFLSLSLSSSKNKPDPSTIVSCAFIEAFYAQDDILRKWAQSLLFLTETGSNVLFLNPNEADFLVYMMVLRKEPTIFQKLFTYVYYINFFTFNHLVMSLFRMNAYGDDPCFMDEDLSKAKNELCKSILFQDFVASLTPPIRHLLPQTLPTYTETFEETYTFQDFLPIPHQVEKEQFKLYKESALQVVLLNILEEKIPQDLIKHFIFKYV